MDQLGFSFRPPERRIWTVRELVATVRTHMEREYGDAWVEGEISNFRAQNSGHMYFTLKDENSQISVVLFRSSARLLRFRPADGMQVVVRGRVTIYEDRGQLQIIAEYVEPKGAGALQIAFEQLKAKLGAEGLFEASRKKPIPALPRVIGIVTSPQAAALRDILHILRRRHDRANVLIYAAQVQGEAAAAEVAAGVRYFNRARSVDVIIVARGGGSAEDLAAFNDEGLARVIAASALPVISAIGHETDFTIADFVADVRAATPSNAAEIVVDRADTFFGRIAQAEQRLLAALRHATGRRSQQYDRLQARLDRWPTSVVMRDRDRHELGLRLERRIADRLLRARQQFENLRRRLERRDVRRVTAELRTRLVGADGRLRAAVVRRRLAADACAGTLAGRLDSLSPLAVLARGYAVCWNESRTRIIRSSQAVQQGDGVRVTLSEGELACRVESVEHHRTPGEAPERAESS